MLKEANTTKVYGVDCKRLGSCYASALLQNVKAKPETMPELTASVKYNRLKEPEKELVRRNIHIAARELLILSGIAPAKVDSVMNNHQQTE